MAAADDLIGKDGQSDERYAVIDGLLVAEQAAVGQEESDLGMAQQILLRQPRGQHDVGWHAVRLAFEFPDDSLRQAGERVDEHLLGRLGQVGAA